MDIINNTSNLYYHHYQMTSEDSSSSSAILTSTGRRASLSLENGMLSIRAASECSLVPLQDIIGCDLQHERNQLVLVIQYWPLRKVSVRYSTVWLVCFNMVWYSIYQVYYAMP